MRRTLTLLAVMLAGIWGLTAGASGTAGPLTGGPSAPPASPGSLAGGSHEIAAAGGSAAPAFVRSASAVLSIVWQESTGPGPRPFSRRADGEPGARRSGITAAALQATLRTRTAAYRLFGSPLALERAGRSSSSPTTPPPFRSV